MAKNENPETTEYNTIWKTFPAKFKWAKVFEENMDEGSDDNEAAQGIKKRKGMWSLDMHVTEDTKKAMIRAGIKEVVNGRDVFHPANDWEGYPYYYKAKRYVQQNFEDRETGEPAIFGPPKVVNLREVYEDEEGRKHASEWSFETDGEIGNGSTGKVVLSIYNKGNKCSVCLQKVAVDEHVPWEKDELILF